MAAMGRVENSGMSNNSGDTHGAEAYTIGAILQGAREANGESIEDIAQILRINWRYIQALEEGRFEDLPGSAYAIGFIRTYSEYLGIDSANIVSQYKALSETTKNKTTLVFPEPIPESGLPGGAIMFAGIFVAVLAYGGWYLATEENSFLARMVAPVPEHLTEAGDQNAAQDEDVGAEQPAEEVPAQPATEPEVVATPDPEAVAESPAETPAAVEPGAEAPVAEIPVAETPIEESPVEEAAAEEVPAAEVPANEEAAVREVEAVATETQSVAEEETAAIQDQVEEEVGVVEPATEPVAVEAPVDQESVAEVATLETPAVETAVAEAPAVDTAAEIVEMPTAETALGIQEPVTVEAVEDSDALALNEEQLRAVQDALGTPEPATVAVEPEVVEPEAVAVVEALPEETALVPASTESNNTQSAAVPTEQSATESATGRVYGEEGEVRIIVRAKTNSWIQVRDDSAGALLLTRLLRAGDEYRVPDRDGLSLLTGNAGALEVLVDGVVVPSIGETGDVRRNVVLDADRLKSGSTDAN